MFWHYMCNWSSYYLSSYTRHSGKLSYIKVYHNILNTTVLYCCWDLQLKGLFLILQKNGLSTVVNTVCQRYSSTNYLYVYLVFGSLFGIVLYFEGSSIDWWTVAHVFSLQVCFAEFDFLDTGRSTFLFDPSYDPVFQPVSIAVTR